MYIAVDETAVRPVVLIYVRFSLISASAGGAWKGQRYAGGLDAHADRILEPARLKARCDIFFDYSVPLLKQAIEQNPDLDINVIVHSTSLMPDEIKARLIALGDSRSFHSKFFAPDDALNTRIEFEQFLGEKLAGKTGKILVPAMRLDDDDLLSPRYFDILKRYLSPPFVGFTVHAPRGYEALFANGLFSAFTTMDAPKTGIGLAHLSLWDADTGKFSTKYILPSSPHQDTDTKAPVILDGSDNVILRTKHVFNDARSTRQGYSFSTAEELEQKFFKNKIDPRDPVLTANFPTLQSPDHRSSVADEQEIEAYAGPKTEVETKKLSGASLDWAIGVFEGSNQGIRPTVPYSTDESLAAYLMEKYDIEVHLADDEYIAIFDEFDIEGSSAKTKSLAVCRTIVTKLRGHSTYIPSELALGLLQCLDDIAVDHLVP